MVLAPPTNYQPSDPTLKILIRSRHLRTADFISLNKVTSLLEVRSSRTEPRKIHLAENAELVLDRDMSTNKRNNDFVFSGDALVSAVRTLMCGYVSTSCLDLIDETWCDLDAALSHLAEVGNFARLNAPDAPALQSKIADAELKCERNGRVCTKKSRGSVYLN